MNRALVCTLTLAIAAVAASASAQVGLSLNLRYDDPADPSEGGSWELVVLGTDVVGVSAILADIDDPTGVITNGNADGATLIDDPNNAGFAPVFSVGGGVYQVGYVQDSTSPLTGGVGAGGPNDIFANTNWDGGDVVITGGRFSGVRPSFDTAGINTTEVNTGTGTPVLAAFATIDGVLSPTVRGDSVGTDGLIVGDLNRSGDVDLFGDVLTALGNVGLSPAGWDDGDFNDSGDVDLFGDVLTALGNVGLSRTPPAVGAVPEPASLSLVAFGLVALTRRRR